MFVMPLLVAVVTILTITDYSYYSCCSYSYSYYEPFIVLISCFDILLNSYFYWEPGRKAGSREPQESPKGSGEAAESTLTPVSAFRDIGLRSFSSPGPWLGSV